MSSKPRVRPAVCKICGVATTDMPQKDEVAPARRGICRSCLPAPARPRLQYQDGQRRCSSCGEFKPVDAYSKNKASSDGLQYHCRVCQKRRWDARPVEERRAHYRAVDERRRQEKREYAAARYRDQRERIRDIQLRHAYGIGVEEYDRILATQDGGCAVCGVAINPNGRRLAVDHCHITGRVRGLLCHLCNVAIGAMRDDPTRLRSAALYVETQHLLDDLERES